MTNWRIEKLASEDATWESYVESCPNSTFFHKLGWRNVLASAFNHQAYYLYAVSGDKWGAALPLFRIKSILFGDALISIPFGAYGGVAYTSEEAKIKIEEHACALAKDLNVDYLEIRNLSRSKNDWPKKDLYVTFQKTISTDHDENLRSIPRKQRAMIRKGEKKGLVSNFDQDIDKFFPIYAESVRNLGTPVFAKKYFKLLANEFEDCMDILHISHEGQSVASVINFYFRDQVIPFYGGSLGRARSLYANDFMYWELMRSAVERGSTVFDFGRSKIDTGPYRFKKHWGFTPQPLSYEYYLNTAEGVPNLSPTNPKYKFFIQAWKKLPMPIANNIGPYLSKYLG